MSCTAVRCEVIDGPYRGESDLAFMWADSGTVNNGVLG